MQISPHDVKTAVADPAFSLVITPDNPCNAALVDRDSGAILYTVSSRFTGSNRVTEVFDEGKKLLATYTRKEIMSDTVQFADDKPQSFTGWIKKSKMPFNDNLHFTHNGVEYKWKGNAINQSLQLFLNDKAANTPILAFAKSWADPRTTPHTKYPAVLQLAPVAAGPGMRDRIVVAFLFLEARRRAKELGSAAFASAMVSGQNAAYDLGGR